MTNYAPKECNTQLMFTKPDKMETLKYKVIASEKQYDNYCQSLEKLVFKIKI